MDGGQLLLGSIRRPDSLAALTTGQWDLLLRLSRRNRLLGRLTETVCDIGILEQIPSKAAEILLAERTRAEHRQRIGRWELDRIAWALAETDIRPVLLKGAAYLAVGLPLSRGRLFADVDILVPKARLKEIEEALLGHGWQSLNTNAYDQRYYREWMHEIPPMRHPEREIEVDLHHTILPLTSRLSPSPDLLFERAVDLAGTRYSILSPEDMVLHCATHLFQDGEIKGALRDLVDIHDLLTDFGRQPDFWSDLLPRAEALDLVRPLYYSLHFCQRLLGTSIPDPVLEGCRRLAPNWVARRLMDLIVTPVLATHHPDRRSAAFAQWLLYLRSHWLRMPPWLLTQHLSRKAMRRLSKKQKAVAD